jgi:hypothetical protein
MRFVTWGLLSLALLHGQDVREIVRRSIDADKHNAEIARSYTFVQREQQREIDSNGKVKKTESDTVDVTLMEGSGYRRHIAHNDRPLPPKEQAKEEEKLRRSIEERKKETPEHRAIRIQDWERRRAKEREPLKEIPDAFDLKLAGEEKVAGVDAWIIDATPHPGYRPRSGAASFFPKVKARCWISKQDYQWAKVEMETLDTISFGAFLLRLAKGSHLSYEAAWVNSEVWLPKHVVLQGAMRVALVKLLRGDVTFDFSDYKKFQAESRLVGGL